MNKEKKVDNSSVETPEDITKRKKNNKRYYIHAQLKKSGHEVIANERFIIKKSRELSDIDEKRIRELIDMGYCVTDKMFPEWEK